MPISTSVDSAAALFHAALFELLAHVSVVPIARLATIIAVWTL